MIVSKTPLRVSLFGGGSDIPEYYQNNGDGFVLSTTIDSYIYIAVNRCQTRHVRAVYSETEVVEEASQLKHDRIREALNSFHLDRNIELCSFSNVSTRGTGLGSSSSFTVGLVNALSRLNVSDNWPKPTKHKIAQRACEIEIDLCKQRIGKQDQYAAAFGGLNTYQFRSDETVDVTPVDVPSSVVKNLEGNLLFYNTKVERSATDILVEQVSGLASKSAAVSTTKTMVDIAKKAKIKLQRGKLDDIGDLLDQSWKLKKSLSTSISNPAIDQMYEDARKSGALGGKILGAGGGGYMVFYVPDLEHANFVSSMHKLGYGSANYFCFTNEGSTVTKC